MVAEWARAEISMGHSLPVGHPAGFPGFKKIIFLSYLNLLPLPAVLTKLFPFTRFGQNLAQAGDRYRHGHVAIAAGHALRF